MKIWPCSLWVEILVNLGIYFLVWPAFCHGNIGKFYLKPYPYYINFWKTKTLLCKLWGEQRVTMGIFSLAPRVIPPVMSQLTTAFLMHFARFTNWNGQTFCKKMSWINPPWAPRLLNVYLDWLDIFPTTLFTKISWYEVALNQQNNISSLSLHDSQAYLRRFQSSRMEIFVKIVVSYVHRHASSYDFFSES